MPSSAKKTWVAKDHGVSETYEVQGTRIDIDLNNTNRVTVYDGDDVVAQLNSVESILPKS
jgi:hypothetical protein